jgi:hypothetical protein
MPEKQKYEEAQRVRRALEKEMSEIGAKLQAATIAADVPEMKKLRLRRDELPELYTEASASEYNLAKSLFGPAYEAAQQKLAQSEAELETRRAAVIKREEEHRREIEELQKLVAEAQKLFLTASSDLSLARDHSTMSQAGYQRALTKLAGA